MGKQTKRHKAEHLSTMPDSSEELPICSSTLRDSWTQASMWACALRLGPAEDDTVLHATLEAPADLSYVSKDGFPGRTDRLQVPQ